MVATTILCLGDSHTRGFYGSDWVSMLQGELGPNVTLVRAGVDGQLARNIAERTPRALADATPTAAVVFAGTNDALACSPDWRLFHERTTGHVLPGDAADAGTFERDVRRILEVIAGAGAAAALVTLPPLDEHDWRDGPGNAVVRELNARLHKIAADADGAAKEGGGGGGVTLLDLYSALEKESARSPPPPPPRRRRPPTAARPKGHGARRHARPGAPVGAAAAVGPGRAGQRRLAADRPHPPERPRGARPQRRAAAAVGEKGGGVGRGAFLAPSSCCRGPKGWWLWKGRGFEG
jgi:lysophospholipase L1-like esterase